MVIADLSSHSIGITTGFTGASVVMFGATDGPGDIVAVVRGPEHDLTIWRKGKIAGIWANAESVTFANVPSFYAVAASRPLDEIVTPSAAALYRIGVRNISYDFGAIGYGRPLYATGVDLRFADALVGDVQQAAVFRFSARPANGRIALSRARSAVRTTFVLPRHGICSDRHQVSRREIFLFRDHQVVGGQTTPLSVSKVGVDATVSDFANRQALGYGAIAVVMAVMAGWIASLPFRNT